jgi:2-(1,2-epoxy-1,2-dihydrophenyl)acetyl-CoA isomerase
LECDEEADIRAVLISAEGRFFSVGGDLAALGESRAKLRSFVKHAGKDFHAGISRIARMNAPVIVAVQGTAAGGGVSLVAAADFAIAARAAKFHAAYPGIGLTVDGGGSYYLPRRVGSRRATSFYLRNQTWTAEQALEYGLLTDVVDDDQLETTCETLAQELAAGPTRSFGELKDLLLSSWGTPLERQLELELCSMTRTGDTDDAQDAIAAVKAKQKPVFRGR